MSTPDKPNGRQPRVDVERPERVTTNLGLPVPGDSDPADVVTDIGNLADAIDAAVARKLFMPGDLKLSAVAVVPSGWLRCDGAAVSRQTFSDLFAAIGTAYGGGDGSTTFNVPNFAGRAPIGEGGAYNLPRGWVGGEYTHTLDGYELPYHSHPVGGGINYAIGSPAPVAVGVQTWAGSYMGIWNTVGGGGWWDYGGQHTIAVGSSYPHNNMQPSTVCPILIKT